MQLSVIKVRKRDYEPHSCWDKRNYVLLGPKERWLIRLYQKTLRLYDYTCLIERKHKKIYLVSSRHLHRSWTFFCYTDYCRVEKETQPVHPNVDALSLKSPVYLLFTFILLRQMLHLLTAAKDSHLKSKAIIWNGKPKLSKSMTEHIRPDLQQYAGSKRFAKDLPSRLAAGGRCQPVWNRFACIYLIPFTYSDNDFKQKRKPLLSWNDHVFARRQKKGIAGSIFFLLLLSSFFFLSYNNVYDPQVSWLS